MRGELVENRVVMWSIKDARDLFGNGYYGKPIGIPKPIVHEIDAPLVLDLIEALYLLEQGTITVSRSNRRVTAPQLREIGRNEHHGFEKKYLVYRSFRDKGYVINPGIKFGCDFAVYKSGPGIDHAPWLVQVYARTEPVTATGIVLAGRLATTVRKEFILAIPRGRDKVDFLSLEWWKA